MALKIDGMEIWLYYEVGESPRLIIDYIPTTSDQPQPGNRLTEYAFQLQIYKLDSMPASLNSQLKRIHEYCLVQVQPPDVDFGDVTLRGTVTPWYYQLNRRTRPAKLNVAYYVNGSLSDRVIPISKATQRLIDNIWLSTEQMAWDDLRTRLGAPARQNAPKRTVYVGYRKSTDPTRQSFVKEIADRLGKEGFYPWWDE